MNSFIVNGENGTDKTKGEQLLLPIHCEESPPTTIKDLEGEEKEY